MGDVERITTTERPLRELVAIAIGGDDCATADWCRGRGVPFCECLKTADAVLPLILQERVRVVEGLVATIKALPTREVHPGLAGFPGASSHRLADDFKTDVLAVVEAAREDTT